MWTDTCVNVESNNHNTNTNTNTNNNTWRRKDEHGVGALGGDQELPQSQRGLPSEMENPEGADKARISEQYLRLDGLLVHGLLVRG